MKKYYKERFEALRRVNRTVAATMEVNQILEQLRGEIRDLLPTAMEACILLLDPEAPKYTRPLNCALYDRPVNCLSCKRNRAAVKKALARNKGVVISETESIIRADGTVVKTGPEAAIPVVVDNDIVSVVHVVARPATRFTRKDFYLIKDISDMAGNAILRARKMWETTQEKLAINQMLGHLSPFVPHSVRQIVENNPELLEREKERREVTVLFLDLEDYTRFNVNRPETEVNEMVERMFSSFVDPIHRSGGDINETAGDGLMIIFKNDGKRTNARNAVSAAFDIDRISTAMSRNVRADLGFMNVNMGINSGTALVGMTRFKGASHTRLTYTATGAVTNVAARLADYASGGDIVIGEETQRLIRDTWPVYDRGEHRFKGMDRPLRAYSLKKQASKTETA